MFLLIFNTFRCYPLGAVYAGINHIQHCNPFGCVTVTLKFLFSPSGFVHYLITQGKSKFQLCLQQSCDRCSSGAIDVDDISSTSHFITSLKHPFIYQVDDNEVKPGVTSAVVKICRKLISYYCTSLISHFTCTNQSFTQLLKEHIN